MGVEAVRRAHQVRDINSLEHAGSVRPANRMGIFVKVRSEVGGVVDRPAGRSFVLVEIVDHLAAAARYLGEHGGELD